MTEEEWLASKSPNQMFELCRRPGTDRKLRLFACSCCRRMWDLIPDPRSQQAVIAAEKYADGIEDRGALATAKKEGARAARKFREFVSAGFSADSLRLPLGRESLRSSLTRACVEAAKHRPGDTIRASEAVADAMGMRALELDGKRPSDPGANPINRTAWHEELAVHSRHLHDIFGNPFRPVAFDLAWRTSTAVALAQQMYDARDFGIMPILGDALHDAGCDNDDILDHCRGPGPHVRGCWVVDLVLGKE